MQIRTIDRIRLRGYVGKLDEESMRSVDEALVVSVGLTLIESYGSGIRRAKDALKENHSPDLLFLPNNDIDDYTMAVVKINEEFAAIRQEEQAKVDITKEMTKEMTKEIKRLMKENPMISATEIAERLEVTTESVRYRIKIMKKSGEIRRNGSTKAGTWEVIESELY